jgi:ABC-type transporter MlaC component
MNERIRELADEARIKFSAHWAHQGVDTAVITRLDLKEFAELIVGECIRKIEDIAESSNNPQPIYRVAVDLLEHFGVEQ